MAPESSNHKPEKKTTRNDKHSKHKAKTKDLGKKNSLIASVIKKIKNNELTIEEAFEKYVISYKTVSERLRCVACNSNHNSDPCPILVFTTEQQKKLRDHIIKCSKTQYGLTNTTIRKMAYEYAKKLPCCDYPKKWDKQNMAGVDWYLNFRSQHPQLKKSLSKTLQHTCICIKGCHMGPEGKEAFEQLEAKIVIARVYHYLQKEYEYMKMCNDLGLLVNILRRTAEATGVCEQTIASILEDEKREAEELHQNLTVHKVKKKRKKKSSAGIDHDYAVNGEENRSNNSSQNEQVKPVAEKMSVDVIDTGPTKINEQVKPVPENMIVDLTDTGPTKIIEQDPSVAENVIVDAMDTGPTNANKSTFIPDSVVKAPETTGIKTKSMMNANGPKFSPDSRVKAPDTTLIDARKMMDLNGTAFSPESGMKAPVAIGINARCMTNADGPTFSQNLMAKIPDPTGINAGRMIGVNGNTCTPGSGMKDTNGIKARSMMNGTTFSPNMMVKIPDASGINATMKINANGPNTFSPDSGMRVPDATGINAGRIMDVNKTSNGIADDGPSPSYSLNPSFSINIEYTDFERLQQNASLIKSVEVEILEDDFDEQESGRDKSRRNSEQNLEDRTLVIDASEPGDEDGVLVIDDNESETTELADIDDITLVIDDNEYQTTTGPADIDDITLVIDDNECQTTARQEDLDDDTLVIDTSVCRTTEQNDQDDVDYKLKEYPIDIKHSKLNEPMEDKTEQNSTDIVSNRAPTKLNELIGNMIEKIYMEVDEDGGTPKINEPAESRSGKNTMHTSDRIPTQLNELIESENEKLNSLYVSKLNGASKTNIATSATKNNNSNANKRRGGIEGHLKRREKCMTEDKKKVKKNKRKEYYRKKEAQRREQEETEKKILRILRKTTGQVRVELSQEGFRNTI